MPVTELCRQRNDTLLATGGLALDIELELARQVRTGETTLTAPPTGFATVQDYRDCLAALEAQAESVGIVQTTQQRLDSGIPATTQPTSPLPADPFAIQDPRASLDTGVTVPDDSTLRTVEPMPLSPSIGSTALVRNDLSSSFLGDIGGTLLDIGRRALEERILPSARPTATGTQTLTTSIAPVQCPEGFFFDPDTQTCRARGVGGFMERMIPGGETGVLSGGQPAQGIMGIPAQTPFVVGSVQRKNGITGPLLRCNPGLILGKDNLCYMKGSIPRSQRKWPKAPRPPVTAGDAKAIRRAESAKRRVKKLAGNVGFSCVTKGSRRRSGR